MSTKIIISTIVILGLVFAGAMFIPYFPTREENTAFLYEVTFVYALDMNRFYGGRNQKQPQKPYQNQKTTKNNQSPKNG